MDAIFPILIMNARPGAGKSEITHALKAISLDERIRRFHIGPMHILDDFPMLWAWFEEDRILETVINRPRLHTTPDEYFLFEDLWHLLIRRLVLEYEKWQRDATDQGTVIIEFSRGRQHGGYAKAYKHISDVVMQRAATLYVNVSFEESLRKNRERYNPDRPDSLLEHGLSDEKLRFLYADDDWSEFSKTDPEFLHVRSNRIPYVVFENEDDVTTPGGDPLYQRLEGCLNALWSIYQKQSTV
jgi:hypothetical protein